MKKALAFGVVLFLALFENGWAQEKFDHSAFDRLLGKHVKQGRVDYAAWKSGDQGKLLFYLSEVAHADPNKLQPRDEKLAFYVNAYNAIVIAQVLENLPLRSTKDVKGFPDHLKHVVGGKIYTLDELARKIRTDSGDPRVLFALNRGAIGYPPLTNRAFRGDSLSSELDAATSACIQDSGYVRLDQKTKVLYVSRIFDWYVKDFEATTGGVRNFLKINLPEASRLALEAEPHEIKYLPFDWKLNAAPGH